MPRLESAPGRERKEEAMRPAAIGIVLALTVPVLALEVGGKAPPVVVSKWISGGQVNPDKPDGKTVYVIEFWATWAPPCRQTIPHLNRLNALYKDRGVVIAGITDEDPAVVEPFARKMKMSYNIGADKDRATYGAYMEGISGIPHAFVINQQGTVVWSGHPMAGLERVIEKVLAGEFDAETARKLADAQREFKAALQGQDVDRVLAALDRLIELQPREFRYVVQKIVVMKFKGGMEEEIRHARHAAAARMQDYPAGLVRVAQDLLAEEDVSLRDPGFMLDCACRAVTLTDGEDFMALHTLAAAYQRVGLIDLAIATEKKALAFAGDDAEKHTGRTQLDYFTKVKAVRGSVSAGDGAR